MHSVISKIQKLALFGALSVALAACGEDTDGKSDDGNIRTAEAPIIETDSPSVDFPPTPQGMPVSEGIRISNIGDGTLKIRSITLVEDTDSDNGGVEFQPGELWEDAATLATDEFIDLDVAYT